MTTTPPERPPNRPGPPNRPSVPRAGIVTGGMTVVIIIGDVTVTIEGPMVKVIAVLNALFGTSTPSAMIANLQLVFGSETAVAVK
jgi:hypothetical protein